MDNKREALRICNGLGGNMNVFKKKENVEQLGRFNQTFWVPIFKNKNEWFDNNNNIVPFLPWAEGQPSGNSECVSVSSHGEYYADSCSYDIYFYCQMKNYQKFSLKGFCKHFQKGLDMIEIDTEYIFLPKEIEKERPTWRGTMTTWLKWNANRTLWELCSLFEDECYASSCVKNNF
jgi:hypothetical protein